MKDIRVRTVPCFHGTASAFDFLGLTGKVDRYTGANGSKWSAISPKEKPSEMFRTRWWDFQHSFS